MHGLSVLLNVGLQVGHVVAAILLANKDLDLRLCLLALAVSLMSSILVVLNHLLVTQVASPTLLVEPLVVSELTNANDHLATGWTNVGACVMGPLNMIGKVFPQNFLGTMLTQHF